MMSHKMYRSLKTFKCVLVVFALLLAIMYVCTARGWHQINATSLSVTVYVTTTTRSEVSIGIRKVPKRKHSKFRRKRHRPPLEDLVQQWGYCDNETRLNARVTDTGLNEKYHKICNDIQRNKTKYFTLETVPINLFRPEVLVTASDTCDSGTDVIILVHSLHDYVTKRAAIRATWGHAVRNNNWLGAKLPLNVRMVFVHGVHRQDAMERKLRKEIVDYGDIIQGNFYEDYNNMTLKSLFGLKWIMTFCYQAKFMIKADDDVFINLPAVLEVLKTSKQTRFVTGPFRANTQAMRVGKWALSRKEYPFFHLPPYEGGSCYAITTDVIPDIYNASLHFKHEIYIEDVYITGMLGKLVNITHLSQPGFPFARSWKPNVCGIVHKRMLVVIFRKPKELMDLWRYLSNGKVINC